MGFVTIYLSEPLTRGLTTGAAVHVLTSQIKYVLGIKSERFRGPLQLIYVSIRVRDQLQLIYASVSHRSESFISCVVDVLVLCVFSLNIF